MKIICCKRLLDDVLSRFSFLLRGKVQWQQKKRYLVVLSIFFGSFGGILFGYDIGVMTGALPFLQSDWNLTNASIVGWITSAVMFGAIFGGAAAGQLSDKFGRRKMILVSAIIFAVFSILSMVSPNNGQFYLIIVRILLGLAVGCLRFSASLHVRNGTG